MVVANDDVLDGQPGLALAHRLAEEPAADVLVVGVGRGAGLDAVSVEHEIPDSHVVGVPHEQHVEAGDARLRQEHRARPRAKHGRVRADLDGVADDEAAPRKEEDASARGIDVVTRSEDRAEVVGLAVALRAVASNVEYPFVGFHGDLRASLCSCVIPYSSVAF